MKHATWRRCGMPLNRLGRPTPTKRQSIPAWPRSRPRCLYALAAISHTDESAKNISLMS